MSIKGFFNNWITKNIIWAVILILVLVFAAHFLLKIVTRHNKEITVPDFTNMTLSEAQTLATKYGMRVQVTDSVKGWRGEAYTGTIRQRETVSRKEGALCLRSMQ